MNRVIIINLNGNAYQLEESGYETLRAYLDNAARRLEGNPDHDEIIADIEQAIADKFRALLGANKTVVITKEVEAVIAEMGPVEDGSTAEPAAAGGATPPATHEAASDGTAHPPRRLYRIYPGGAMLSGVCNGLAAYFNIDVTIVRLLFLLLCFFWGAGIWGYLAMVVIVPLAKTAEEKAAASGGAATAQEFIRRAKAGYYEGMKTFHDKHAHREWKRKFKQEMRGWKYDFQRQMDENVYRWQQHWGPHSPYWTEAGLARPFLKLLKLLLFVFCLFAIYSLLTKGIVYGLLLPLGLPVWLGVVLLIVLYQLAVWPIKVMRHSLRWRGAPYYGCGACGTGLFGVIVWLGILTFLIWLADRHVPGFHEVLKQIPPLIDQGTITVQEWWAKK